MNGKAWTQQEKELLEECYKQMMSMDDMKNLFDRSSSEITSKAYKMELTKKYVKKNSANYKAIYQDYDWCYDRYIVRGMNQEEMAKEAGTTVRTIQKWCSDIHGLNIRTYKKEKHINEMQRQIILYGTLGDGHIDNRPNHPLYIESHAIDEKDYLFWKYSFLKDLCNSEPVYYPEKTFNYDLPYICSPSYRMCTRVIDDLKEIRNMSRLEKIKSLNEFGFCLHTLDDGSRSDKWEVCLAEWSDEEVDAYMKFCAEQLNLNVHRCRDDRYVSFTAASSAAIDKIILKHIPNDLDIIKKKILDNCKIKPLKRYRYVIFNGERMGLRKFSDIAHVSYIKSKDIFDEFGKEEIDGDLILEKLQ